MSSNLSESVKERKLRPIYELLDSGNNKKVITEADRMLKKTPDFLCLKVLKGLALLRMGKREECFGMIDPVRKEVPTDENTIQALSICYRELDRHIVCTLLEDACEKEKSEDLLTFCFMSHVRVSDFQKQYTTAMALYKLYPKTPYFSWGIMSLYMKASTDPPELAQRVTLPLAERSFAKFIVEHEIQTEHELDLYLLILLRQKNFTSALGIMDTYSKKGIAWRTGTCLATMLQCLRETNQIEKHMQLLEANMLNKYVEWNLIEEYIVSYWETNTERVIHFIQLLRSSVKTRDPGAKSTILARMHLFNLLRLKFKDSSTYETEFFEALHEYVQHFGNKQFLACEIPRYLESITSQKDQDELIEVSDALAHNTTDFVAKIDRYMNSAFIYHLFRKEEMLSDPSKTLDWVKTYVRRYINCNKQVSNWDGESEDKTQEKRGPVDGFLTLSSLLLTESFWAPSDYWKEVNLINDLHHLDLQSDDNRKEKVEKVDSSSVVTPQSSEASVSNGLAISDSKFNLPEKDFPVLLTLAILEYGLSKSKDCSQLRLLLGKVYNFCGATVAGTNQFMSLDIKHCQIESLGYLFLWKAVSSGVLSEANRLLTNAEGFYTTHSKESVEHILSAYKFGSWDKIKEFMEFRDSVVRSIQTCLVKVEKRLIDFTIDANSRGCCLEIAQREEYDAIAEVFKVSVPLTENRDFKLLNIYCKMPSAEMQKLTLEDDLIRLKVRSSFLSLINAFVLAVAEFKDDIKLSRRIDHIEVVLPFFRDIVETDLSELNVVQPNVNGPWAPSMFNYKSLGYMKILLDFSTIFLKVLKGPVTEDFSKDINSLISQFDGTMNRLMTEFGDVKFLLVNLMKLNEAVFAVIESLGFCTILTWALKEVLLLKKANAQVGKAKKKKGKDLEVSIDPSITSFNCLVNSLLQSYLDIGTQISKFKFACGDFFPTALPDLKEMWKGKVSEEIEEEILLTTLPIVMDKLNTSFYRAYSEMKLSIGRKSQFLQSLVMYT